MKIPHKHSVRELGVLADSVRDWVTTKNTAYERLKGKKAGLLGIASGAMVNWRTEPATEPLGKLASMWSVGVDLGARGTSGEVISGNGNGVWHTRTIRRKLIENRWVRNTAEVVVGVSWPTSDDDPKVDGEQCDVTFHNSPRRNCS